MTLKKNNGSRREIVANDYHLNNEIRNRLNSSKVSTFPKTLIEQVDTMGSIANDFSDFATLYIPKKQKWNLVDLTQFSVDIFHRNDIEFTYSHSVIMCDVDCSQWIRVMTNLIQNALQSVSKKVIPDTKLISPLANKKPQLPLRTTEMEFLLDWKKKFSSQSSPQKVMAWG